MRQKESIIEGLPDYHTNRKLQIPVQSREIYVTKLFWSKCYVKVMSNWCFATCCNSWKLGGLFRGTCCFKEKRRDTVWALIDRKIYGRGVARCVVNATEGRELGYAAHQRGERGRLYGDVQFNAKCVADCIDAHTLGFVGRVPPWWRMTPHRRDCHYYTPSTPLPPPPDAATRGRHRSTLLNRVPLPPPISM